MDDVYCLELGSGLTSPVHHPGRETGEKGRTWVPYIRNNDFDVLLPPGCEVKPIFCQDFLLPYRIEPKCSQKKKEEEKLRYVKRRGLERGSRH